MLDWDFLKKHNTLIRDKQPNDRLEEHAFPAPALTDDNNSFTFFDIKVQPFEDLIVTERKPHSLDTDQWNTSLAMK
jgi:hypothetical protein